VLTLPSIYFFNTKVKIYSVKCVEFLKEGAPTPGLFLGEDPHSMSSP
jgi:hypothetical protein